MTALRIAALVFVFLVGAIGTVLAAVFVSPSAAVFVAVVSIGALIAVAMLLPAGKPGGNVAPEPVAPGPVSDDDLLAVADAAQVLPRRQIGVHSREGLRRADDATTKLRVVDQ